MDFREFSRHYLLKTLLAFVALQIAIVAIIQNFNHRPMAMPDQASVIEERSVKIAPLSNDMDKDKTDELSILQVGKPLHGSVRQDGNLLYYSPEKGFAGADSLEYTISDGRKESKSSTITFQVNKNLEPIAGRDISEVYCENSIFIDVLKNDTDREGDSIFIKGFSNPIYGKLEIFGNQLIYSAKNTSVQSDSFRYVASDGKNNSDSTTVYIKIRSKNDPCYPWISSDIGDAAVKGSFSYINKAFIIEASGSDIWNSNDGLRFAYQYVTGDCEMYTKIESLEGTNDWAKAGIMVRESLSGGSRTAFVCVTNKNGVTSHQRTTSNEGMTGGNGTPDIKAPYWVKLSRKGNSFSYYVSADGTNWNKLGNAEVPMANNVYIGFAVTSHNNQELCKATFCNYRLIGKVTAIRYNK